MKKNKEIELKLRLPNAQLGKDIMNDEFILSYAQSKILEVKCYEAIYLDSEEGNLNEAGLALRIRKEGEKWVATVKTKGSSVDGLHSRDEWDVEIENPVPSIEYFKNTSIYTDLQAALGGEILTSLFTTKFERRIVNLSVKEKSLIELAIDIGEIIVKNRREEIAEVELELKSGEAEDLSFIGDILIQKYGLVPEERSKFYRGLMLMKE